MESNLESSHAEVVKLAKSGLAVIAAIILAVFSIAAVNAPMAFFAVAVTGLCVVTTIVVMIKKKKTSSKTRI